MKSRLIDALKGNITYKSEKGKEPNSSSNYPQKTKQQSSTRLYERAIGKHAYNVSKIHTTAEHNTQHSKSTKSTQNHTDVHSILLKHTEDSIYENKPLTPNHNPTCKTLMLCD
jgi:hypothetical protein